METPHRQHRPPDRGSHITSPSGHHETSTRLATLIWRSGDPPQPALLARFSYLLCAAVSLVALMHLHLLHTRHASRARSRTQRRRRLQAQILHGRGRTTEGQPPGITRRWRRRIRIPPPPPVQTGPEQSSAGMWTINTGCLDPAMTSTRMWCRFIRLSVSSLPVVASGDGKSSFVATAMS